MDAISIKIPSLRIQKSRFLYPLLAVLFLLGNIFLLTASTNPGIGNNQSSLNHMVSETAPYPGIIINKTTNTFEDIVIPVGDAITWSYAVTNIGNVDLTDILVTDSALIMGSELVAAPTIVTVGTIPLLTVGETITLTMSGTAAAGFYENVGAATFTYGNMMPVTVADLSCYYGINPDITIDKTTNGADGLYIPVGDPITWSYNVTNTGNLYLFNIIVTDDILGDVGTIPMLAPSESADTMTMTGTAVAGLYENTGVATASYFAPVFDPEMYEYTFPHCDEEPDTMNFAKMAFDWELPTVSDSDESSYFGFISGITLDKTTNGGDGLIIPVGDEVTWSYLVTNTSNFDLMNVVVTDSDLGPVGTIDLLPAGQSTTLTMTGTAVAGAYENTGVATGTPTSGGGVVVGVDVTASDVSSYFGSAPAITIDKTVQNVTTAGTAAKSISGTAGHDFLYTLVVTNTGNVALSDIVILDNMAVVGSSVTVDGTATTWAAGTGGFATVTIPTLTAGQAVTITYTYDTAETDATTTHVNVVTATGTETSTLSSETPTSVSDADAATIALTGVQGASRTTVTPAPTATATTAGSNVLGATKTGEVSNTAEIIIGMTLLAGAIGLIFFLQVRRNRKSDMNG